MTLSRTSSGNSINSRADTITDSNRRTAEQAGLADSHNPPIRNIRPRQQESVSQAYAQPQQPNTNDSFDYVQILRKNAIGIRFQNEIPAVFQSLIYANSEQAKKAIIYRTPQAVKIIQEISSIGWDNEPRRVA